MELLALAPVVATAGALCLQALAAGATHVYADGAAHAAALAVASGRDPVAAARAAVPGWSAGRVSVARRGDAVAVRLRPRAIVPPLASLVAAGATASAAGARP